MKVYADNAATTRTSEAALEAMMPCFTQTCGNPSSVHSGGQEAAAVVERARQSIAGLVNALPREIYFISGGTEADNWAIRAIAQEGAAKGKKHIISSAFEHHAVFPTLQPLDTERFEVTLLAVPSDGLVLPAVL